MTSPIELVQPDTAGLHCPAGGFHIDPWRPVECAVITHAHADHFVAGCGKYITSSEGLDILRLRLGDDAVIEPLDYAVPRVFGKTVLTLHPAGHIRGSAQVSVEETGHVTVVTGDFKCERDPTCRPFEPLPCDTLFTESTFGLPIHRWPDPQSVIADIEAWWRANQEAGRASVLFAYALGKAQRVLASLNSDIGPIYTHGAIEKLCAVYRSGGVALPETTLATNLPRRTDWSQSLILAPPSAIASPWLKRFGRISTGLVSGWMRVRGIRRRRSIDRGFVLSDHADWPSLLQTIQQSGAKQVRTTHGYSAVLARYLRERGIDAVAVETHFHGEADEDVASEASDASSESEVAEGDA